MNLGKKLGRGKERIRLSWECEDELWLEDVVRLWEKRGGDVDGTR